MTAATVTRMADVTNIMARANAAKKELPITTPTPRRPQQPRPEMTDFWESRPLLRNLRDAARSSLVSPEAVLATTLVDVTSATEPGLQLPPIIGGYASLNMFAALVGPSGVGKGSSASTARRILTINNVGGFDCRAPIYPDGTGEGIVRIFAGDGSDSDENEPPPTRAIIDIPEIDSLGAKASRQGATIMPTLRSAYMGEQLGSQTSEKARRTRIAPHTYRMGLIAGVQPLRAGIILDDADGGTPQRFLWAPVNDPQADRNAAGTWKSHITVKLPSVPSTGAVMEVAKVAADAIIDARIATITGPLERRSLDGHALLTRLKVAAALALLDGRLDVSSDDWELSSFVMAMSDWTRNDVIRIRENEAQKQRDQRATDRGQDYETTNEARLKTRARNHAHRWADRRATDQWIPGWEIAKAARSEIREYVLDALDDAHADGLLDKATDGNVVMFRKAQ